MVERVVLPAIVGGDRAQVVEPVRDRGRVEGDRVGRARVRAHGRPGASACGRALEGERGDSAAARIGAGAGQRNSAAKRRARVVNGGARSRVVDRDGDASRGEGVAGRVRRHRAQVVVAVRDSAGYPVDRVRGARVGVDRRPRPGSDGRALEGDLGDARDRVGRARRDGDGSGQRGAAGGGGERAGRVAVVDLDRLLGRVQRVAGSVRRACENLVVAVRGLRVPGDRVRGAGGARADERRRAARRSGAAVVGDGRDAGGRVGGAPGENLPVPDRCRERVERGGGRVRGVDPDLRRAGLHGLRVPDPVDREVLDRVDAVGAERNRGALR